MNFIPWLFFPSLLLLVGGVYMQGIRDGHLKGWRDHEDDTGIIKFDLTK